MNRYVLYTCRTYGVGGQYSSSSEFLNKKHWKNAFLLKRLISLPPQADRSSPRPKQHKTRQPNHNTTTTKTTATCQPRWSPSPRTATTVKKWIWRSEQPPNGGSFEFHFDGPEKLTNDRKHWKPTTTREKTWFPSKYCQQEKKKKKKREKGRWWPRTCKCSKILLRWFFKRKDFDPCNREEEGSVRRSLINYLLSLMLCTCQWHDGSWRYQWEPPMAYPNGHCQTNKPLNEWMNEQFWTFSAHSFM